MSEIILRAHAYNPEGQAIIVYKAQEAGTPFTTDTFTYYFSGIREVDGTQMRTINNWRYFLEVHCNTDEFNKLKQGDTITEIFLPGERNDFSLGRDAIITAALLTQNNVVLYKSPGFDIEKHLED